VIRHRWIGGVAVLVCLGGTAAAARDIDVQRAAIARLGELNGVALHCGYLDQVRRMKEAIVRNAPQERVFGADFDSATNRAFLDFIEDGRSCPGSSGFATKVGARIEALEHSFAEKGS
jgi:hypothetical protein